MATVACWGVKPAHDPYSSIECVVKLHKQMGKQFEGVSGT